MNEKNTPKSNSEKLSIMQMLAYGAGGIIPIALFNSVGILIGLMGNISLGLSAFWLGLILIIPRLWDAISDPFIGHLSDNTRTKWGRRRPFLLWGGILTAILFVVLWWIPKGETVAQWFPSESGYQTFQLIYILITLLLFFTAVNLFEIPHGALGMEMTSDYHERTKLFSIKSLVGNLFAMSTPWLFWMANREYFKGPGGTEMDGMRYVSLFIAALLIPLSIWWFFKLKEPKFYQVKEQQKNNFWKDMKMVVRNRNFIFLTLTIFTLAMGFNFVSLLGSYIPIFYIFGGDKDLGSAILGINGTVWAITGMLAVLPLNIISPKFGKRNTLIIAISLMVLAQLSKIVCYNPEHPYLIVIPTVLLSAGMLFFFTLGSSMVGDICDEEELKTGQRSEGSFYSVFWWFIKMGSALASFVAGALIVYTMFDESQVTKVDKLQSNIDATTKFAQEWNKHINTNSFSTNVLTTYKTDAVKESEEQIKLMEIELEKNAVNPYLHLPEYQKERLVEVQKYLTQAKENLNSLNGTIIGTDSLSTQTLFKQINQSKLIKTHLTLYDLYAYVQNKTLENNVKHKVHYMNLLPEIEKMQNQLKTLNPINTIEYQTKMEQLKEEIVPLKKQTPYTLFMMRVVEIGIPILLSLFSLFFVLKYTLTEKRSLEIKELLASKDL
jgi:GPH family glycoside/pentoside/hexuronide:cation symporter